MKSGLHVFFFLGFGAGNYEPHTALLTKPLTHPKNIYTPNLADSSVRADGKGPSTTKYRTLHITGTFNVRCH